MHEVIPDSRSMVLRARQILVVQVEQSLAHPSQARPIGGVERSVDLTVHVDDVLKGTVRVPPDGRVHARVQQTGTGTSRVAAVPGAWSSLSLDPGTRWVVFAAAADGGAGDVLSDPGVFTVLPAAGVVPGLNVVQEAELHRWNLHDLLVHAWPVAGALDVVFVEYLWARHGEHALAEPDAWEHLMAFLEAPALGQRARSALVSTACDAVLLRDPSVGPQRDALAVALFRVLALPEAAVLRDNILGTYLPNILGLTGGASRARPDEVFRQHPAERAEAVATVGSLGAVTGADMLRAWLAHGVP